MLHQLPTRRRSLTGLVLACCLGVAGLASAQNKPVKPYVMVLFDTSGSMLWTVCSSNYSTINGDNSKECPGKAVSCSSCNTLGCGNGVADDSRLYKAKRGAHSVVSAFGEVTFGLSRFRMTPTPFGFSCNVTYTYYFGVHGGWRGSDCSSSMNRADVLVPFADNNQQQILQWMNNCDDYPSVGSCPGTTAPSSGCKLCAECGGGCDKELRGGGATPIAGSLRHLRLKYFNKVIAADSKKGCRPYKVILLTDGAETCGGNPANEAAALFKNSGKSIPVHVVGFGSSSLQKNLDKIAVAGGTKKAVVVDNEVSLALAMASIISESLLHEKCNGKDDDCDDYCDEDFPEVAVTGAKCKNKSAAKSCTAGLGICLRTGYYKCKADGSGSECKATAGPPNKGGEICNNGLDDDCDGAVDEGCKPTCVPQVEICDNKDNDCDKLVDEGYVPVSCGSNVGACKSGMTACSSGVVTCKKFTGPKKEICDNIDNNCDTIVDTFSVPCYTATTGCDLTTMACKGNCKIGTKLCTKGNYGACQGYVGPLVEVCNGQDDNCNGQVDEGVGQMCTKYATCSTYTTCFVCAPKPAEKCDNIDNDCNGKIDDNVPGVGQSCGTAIGECTKGTLACEKGVLSCKKGKGPQKEICDNKDNDCNGKIDDLVPGMGLPCGDSVGECKPGAWQCIGGKKVCKGGTPKTAEICDCKDNDCDGKTDEDNPCGTKGKCVNCKCTVPCAKSEFPCPGGMKCGKDGYCLPDKCSSVKCKATERCVDGKCVGRCVGVTCKAHQKCDANTGLCVDDSCYTSGCTKGQICVDYKCIADPCPPDKCPPGQMCYDGKCFKTCLNVSCPSDQVCVQGRCRKADPCDVKTCPESFICKVVNGAAVCDGDPCRFANCGKDLRCFEGKCVRDPCVLTRCPAGLQCKVNRAGQPECLATGEAKVPTTHKMLASGGGGCAVGPGAPGVGAAAPLCGVLLLGLLALLRRRGA